MAQLIEIFPEKVFSRNFQREMQLKVCLFMNAFWWRHNDVMTAPFTVFFCSAATYLNLMKSFEIFFSIVAHLRVRLIAKKYLRPSIQKRINDNNTIFDLKIMVKSGLEKFILKYLHAGRWLFLLLNLWFWALLWNKRKYSPAWRNFKIFFLDHFSPSYLGHKLYF